jgi:hypothetical protein
MSVANNNLIREVNPGRSLFASLKPVLSTSCNWNQGDILAYDATNNIVNAVTGTGSSANVVGVAVNTIVSGVMPSPYQGTAVDASAAIEDAAGPLFGNVFSMALKTGDSWVPGQKAYLTSDPQTLTSAVTGNAVGIFQGAAVTSAASGTYGDFLMGAAYNLSALTF